MRPHSLEYITLPTLHSPPLTLHSPLSTLVTPLHTLHPVSSVECTLCAVAARLATGPTESRDNIGQGFGAPGHWARVPLVPGRVRAGANCATGPSSDNCPAGDTQPDHHPTSQPDRHPTSQDTKEKAHRWWASQAYTSQLFPSVIV